MLSTESAGSKMQTDARKHLEGLQKKLTVGLGLPVNFIQRCDLIGYAKRTANGWRDEKGRIINWK